MYVIYATFCNVSACLVVLSIVAKTDRKYQFWNKTFLRSNVWYPRNNITVTSQWAPWRVKSPAYGLFAQSFVQLRIKENIKAPRHWPLWGETIGFPSQRASNAENVVIWWRDHENESIHEKRISRYSTKNSIWYTDKCNPKWQVRS